LNCKVTHNLLIIKRKDTFFREKLIFITINGVFFVILHLETELLRRNQEENGF